MRAIVGKRVNRFHASNANGRWLALLFVNVTFGFLRIFHGGIMRYWGYVVKFYWVCGRGG